MERAQLESLIAVTGCAEQHGGYTFLIDPHWSLAQCEKFAAIRQSEIGNEELIIDHGWLCIPTGGSSGGLKFARHDEQTLSAAVDGFCAHFGLDVSGLMSRVRCAATGGRYIQWKWKMLEAEVWPELSGEEMISLVPTQLQRLLEHPKAVTWLRKFKLILIGGGPGWSSLEDTVASAKLPVVFSYGMTETAAMIAAQTPDEIAAGDRSSGRLMRHAQVEICEVETGKALDAAQSGLIRISGGSVMRGYYGEACTEGFFTTADLGRIDHGGQLYIEGRRDDVIITGGENVSARAIEATLRDCDGLADIVVLGLPHAEWGEEVVVCFPSEDPESEAALARWAAAHLKKHQCPKRILRFQPSDWPRNDQGKVNRAKLRRLALMME